MQVEEKLYVLIQIPSYKIYLFQRFGNIPSLDDLEYGFYMLHI